MTFVSYKNLTFATTSTNALKMKSKNYSAACAVLANTLDGNIIADLADLANVRGRLVFVNAAPHPYICVSLKIPLPLKAKDIEQGVPRPNAQDADHRINIKLPQGCYTYTTEEASPEVNRRVAGDELAKLLVVNIKFNEGATSGIAFDRGKTEQGWSMPFVSVSDPRVDSWIKNYEVIADTTALLSVVRGTSFLLVVRAPKDSIDSKLDETRLPPVSDHGSSSNLLASDVGGVAVKTEDDHINQLT
ncbi:DNA helicase [Colletotrichum plurivorum]|uniref:DNA helicase n=1 Tax=Colletotrichum plurivorum TaxID=2175906 RepID=A0A8H6KX18_9PEZI|nr:DNA helicase [Colletotrichum plurivorum]